MTAFDLLKEFGHEQLVISQDPGANYVGIVAIHDGEPCCPRCPRRSTRRT